MDLPDAGSDFAAVDVLPAKDYFTGKERLSKRHRVRDNLLGGAKFCPVIRRTEVLEKFVASNLSDQAKETVGKIGGSLVTRTASFMLLADSQASFEIEGERPPRNRLERWGRAVAQAGRFPLSLEEIIRLHSLLIEDRRFIEVGLRSDGVFLGERDAQNNPLPEFIGARHDDLNDLIEGVIAANDRMGSEALDPVLQAAAIADLVEMPDRLTQNLVMFIRQNGGALHKRRREKEFEALTDNEIAALEAIVREEFDGFDGLTCPQV